jgi:hypothetical protein
MNKPNTLWRRDIYRNGKLLYRDEIHNLVTNQGQNHMLDVVLHGTTPITTWYLVMSETNTTPALTMTYATPAFTETQAYAEATRPAYVEAASSSQSVTNAANKGTFTMNASKTLYGAGLVGGGTDPTVKANTAGGGTLLNFALFSVARDVISGDVVNLTKINTAADDGV